MACNRAAARRAGTDRKKYQRIDDLVIRGFAIGLTAHAIGMAHALQVSDIAGAFAALAMGLNGVITTLLLPLMVQLAGSR